MVKLSALQLTSVPDVDENLATIDKLLSTLEVVNEHIVVLPECCLFFGGEEKAQLELAKQAEHSDYLQKKLANLARKHKVYLVAGTIPKLASLDKFTNTSCVFSPSGQLLASYQKMHLFDVNVADTTKVYFESSYTQAGKTLGHVDLGFAHLGLSVCYDLRFPELYRALRQQGVNIFTVPSAFTEHTGKAHWQALLQARAIENQCYIIAAGQQGKHTNGRITWGHSMVISPWGEILASKAEGEGSISVNFDLAKVTAIRENMPVNEHNKFKVEFKN